MKKKLSIALLCSLWGLFGVHLSASVPLKEARNQVNSSRVRGKLTLSAAPSDQLSYAKLRAMCATLSHQNKVLLQRNLALEKKKEKLGSDFQRLFKSNKELFMVRNPVLAGRYEALSKDNRVLLQYNIVLEKGNRGLNNRCCHISALNERLVVRNTTFKRSCRMLLEQVGVLSCQKVKYKKEQKKSTERYALLSSLNSLLHDFNKDLSHQNATSVNRHKGSG